MNELRATTNLRLRPKMCNNQIVSSYLRKFSSKFKVKFQIETNWILFSSSVAVPHLPSESHQRNIRVAGGRWKPLHVLKKKNQNRF